MIRTTSLVVVSWCLLFPAFSGAQSQGSQGTSVGAMPQILWVASAAYRDFDSELKGWEKKWQSGGKTESQAQQYASDIRNYKVEISVEESRVYVTFTVRPFQGAASFGGVTHYVLDEKTAAILEHTGDK
jgi:hypothetical protein